MPFPKSNTATPSCKICHKPIEVNSIFSLIFTPKAVCLHCFLSLNPKYYRWRFQGVDCYAIYPYSPEYRNLIYLYKGCGDMELGPTFIERVGSYFRIKFRGYVIVPAPSHPNKVRERGFDHLPFMFKSLGLPIIPAIEKTDDVKQSDLNAEQRRHIGDHLRFVPGSKIKGKKILLVDDVFTTGSTMRACLGILRKHKAGKIAILVVAKVVDRH